MNQEYELDHEKGVLTINGRRVLALSAPIFQSSQSSLRNVLGKRVAKSVLYIEGQGLGKGGIQQYRNLIKNEQDLWRVLDSVMRERGWGKISSHTLNAPNVHVVTIENSIVSEGLKSNEPNCDIIRGILAGWTSSYCEAPVKCEEIKCTAMGHTSCQFFVTISPGAPTAAPESATT